MSKNLIRAELTQEDVRKVLAAYPRRPLLPALDSAPWKKAAQNPVLQPLIKAIRDRAEKEIDQPLPLIGDDIYLIYSKTGSRWEFEVTYFERRRQLARAAISLLLSAENDPLRPRLIKSVLAKLTDIFDEVAWAFPAHVKDPSKRDPFEIDLFCAETANLMTEMIDIFGAVIPDELKKRILARLRSHIWQNYLDKANSNTLWWLTYSNNWNAVCTHGVIGSALSALDDHDMLAEMLMMARKNLPIFLSGFGPDGGSSEGPGYWDYGFGWYVMLSEQLETRTEGELSLLIDDPHVLEIARFGPRGSLAGGHLICFSDSPPIGSVRPSNLLYLGERLNEALCHEQGINNYSSILKKGLDLDFQRSDLIYLGRFLLRCPESLPEKPLISSSKDVYLKDLAVVIASAKDAKGHLWEFAAKAGHNEEHHNHNDCGNYILNLDAHRFVTEIGQPLYTREFFSEKRYENLAARSLGHSVPLINGAEQAAGKKYTSTVLDYSNTAKETRFVIDLTNCYPVEAACQKLIRTFLFEKEAGRLTVRDDFELTEARSVETAVVTIHPAKADKDSVTISAHGLYLVLRLDPGTVFASADEHPYRHHDPMITEPVSIHRVVLKPATLSNKFSLGFVAHIG